MKKFRILDPIRQSNDCIKLAKKVWHGAKHVLVVVITHLGLSALPPPGMEKSIFKHPFRDFFNH